MKHKHYEVIMAWAENPSLVIQYKEENGEWFDVYGNIPAWGHDDEYRIKPPAPKWPETKLKPEKIMEVIRDAKGDYLDSYFALANAALAHSLETGQVVLPSNARDDAEKWGSALNEASWAFIETCPEKSALLFNNCKVALRDAILKYFDALEKK